MNKINGLELTIYSVEYDVKKEYVIIKWYIKGEIIDHKSKIYYNKKRQPYFHINGSRCYVNSLIAK